MDYLETLTALTAAAGPSGNEAGVANVAAALFRRHTADVWRDPLGNVYARMGEGRPVVLVCAHMDEIALAVAAIEDNGMLRLARVGGVDPRVLPGSEVVVHGARDLPGVIGAVPPHLLGSDRDAAYPLEDLACDTGYPAETLRTLVSVGDMVTFAPLPPLRLANGFVTSKTLDDRALVACMCDAMEMLARRSLACTAVFCATVQEELGCHGAAAAGHHIHPDIGIALDVCHAPTPDAPSCRTTPPDKAALTRGGNIHPGVYEMLKRAATETNVPFATAVTLGATGTDARTLQLQQGGIPTGLLELPLRYMHTSVELGSLDTLHGCAKILAECIASLDDGWEDALCWND